MSLKVKFVGAVGTVTGSCSVLHHTPSDSYYLVDCGLFQGGVGDEERNRRKFSFEPSRLSAVFLTHAHIDHCGLIPRLIAEGFRGKVICTRATAEFSIIALKDSARRGDQPYAVHDVQELEDLFECPDEREDFRFGYFYPIVQDFLFGFIRTAHIVGSVAIEFRVNVSPTERKTIVFSGDVGVCTDGEEHGGIQKERQYPNPEIDYLVSESTYGGKSRDPEAATFLGRTKALTEMLDKAFSRGPQPVVIIPSFSLQRAQDLAFDLVYVLANSVASWGTERTVSVVIDSGMAREHAAIMCRELLKADSRGKYKFLNLKAPIFSDLSQEQIGQLVELVLGGQGNINASAKGRRWQLVYGPWEEQTLADGPVVVVASAGNCLGGPVIRHLVNHVKGAQTTVAFSGYVPPASPGFKLKLTKELASVEEREKTTVTLGDASFKGSEVAATIEDLSAYYSGHADEAGLVDFILRRDTDKPSPPITVFLNHGDQRARAALKERLFQTAQSAEGVWRRLDEIYLPEASQGWFDLLTGQWDAPESSSAELNARIDALERKVDQLLANQEDILAHLKSLLDQSR